MDELHGEEGLKAKAGVGRASLVNLGDAGMVKAAKRLKLAFKAAEKLRAGPGGFDEFERDTALVWCPEMRCLFVVANWIGNRNKPQVLQRRQCVESVQYMFLIAQTLNLPPTYSYSCRRISEAAMNRAAERRGGCHG